MDERLDQAIDQVAREMTAADPPSALRADVLARIERDRNGRSPGRLLPRWALAGGIAVLVIGVAITGWLARTVPAPAAGERASIDTAAKPATDQSRLTPPSEARLAADAAVAAVQPVPQSRPARPAARPQRIGLPEGVGPSPLAGPDAIDIAPLGPAAIAVPGLGVAALTDIEPITVSTIGPGSPEPQRRDRE
jgi:hypothetical protein